MYQPPEPNDEMLQCFDENRNVIEPHTREEVHAKPLRYWHGVTNIWIVGPDARLLCSKRSDALKGNPGKWQTYFGGHMKAGTTFRETAHMELDEEIGLTIDDGHLKRIAQGTNEDSKHFFESYAYLYRGDIADLRFNDGEIVEAKWMEMDEYWKQKESHPEEWCNGCTPENQESIKRFVREKGE